MAINFATFDKQQFEVTKRMAAEIDERPEVSDVIEFRGGFLPKMTYVAAIKAGRLDMVDIIPPTRTGAIIARNITLLAGLGTKSLEAVGETDRAVQLRMAAALAIRFACEETVHASYHDWYQACENVPADLSETHASVLFAGEVLDAMLQQLREGLGELLAAASEVKRATLH